MWAQSHEEIESRFVLDTVMITKKYLPHPKVGKVSNLFIFLLTEVQDDSSLHLHLQNAQETYN